MEILEKIKRRPIFSIYLILWTLYFFLIWSRMLSFDSKGNLVAGHVNVWGDGAIHFTMGSAMAFRDLLPENSPFVWNQPFRYPLFANFVSAVLVRLGVPFFSAFTIPSFFVCVCGAVLLFMFYEKIFRSEVVAFLGAMIFLLNGGLGFLYFLLDVATSQNPFRDIFLPPFRYTSAEDLQIRWINVIESMFIPQRAFQFGFLLSLIILIGLYSFVFSEKQKIPRWKMMVLGGLMGFLPIVHTHSFVALSLILGFWFAADIVEYKNRFVSKRLSLWLLFALCATFVSVPTLKMYPLFTGGHVEGMKWYPGWYSRSWHINFIWMWVKNWGPTLIIGLVGMLYWVNSFIIAQRKLHKALFLAPFILWFILPNLIQFHPWIWDNTKFFLWSSLGFSAFAGYALQWVKNKMVFGLALFSMIASGALDVYRTLLPSLNSYQMYSSEELNLADWIKGNTDPNSLWLTGTEHNNLLYNLTGRQSLVTFEGWLWTHGYEYRDTWRVAQTMFYSPETILKNKEFPVRYVLIGPSEIRDKKANVTEFRRLFEVLHQTENYILFKIKSET